MGPCGNLANSYNDILEGSERKTSKNDKVVTLTWVGRGHLSCDAAEQLSLDSCYRKLIGMNSAVDSKLFSSSPSV